MVDIILKIKRHIEAQLPRAYNVSYSYIYLHIFRMELDMFMNDYICELISDYNI
jgi:predicted component of type VI protein secretion system